MPLAVQGGDVVLHDGPVAPVALRREHVEVVVAAVRLAVALVEPVLAELLAALGAEEVLRVPRFLERCDTFLKRDNQTRRNKAKVFHKQRRVHVHRESAHCSRRTGG